MATRFIRRRFDDGATQIEQTQTILRERGKDPVRRLDPDSPAATVQVIDSVTGDVVGLGEIQLSGAAIKSASFDSVEGRVTVKIVPRFDISVDFGTEEESFS